MTGGAGGPVRAVEPCAPDSPPWAYAIGGPIWLLAGVAPSMSGYVRGIAVEGVGEMEREGMTDGVTDGRADGMSDGP